MKIDYSTYETVIGLEVHAQLKTNSKLFCGDSIAFGAMPNTHISPITLAHPGTLPKMNEKAIELAVKMGLVCHCEIEQENYFARKNYFYADLPKGYQISQHTTPICKGGYLVIVMNEGEREIRLNRIHLEEDAGKSIHDADKDYTCIDLNRAGTPLIEIVTEPDLRSSEEAFACLTEIRKLVRYLDVCDGNMEEGSLRCDANISVRKRGDTKLGTKVEIKNLNSIRNVKKAIEYEAPRLMQLLFNNETILQETRSFEAATGTTFATREKEDADDYRYFPDPDLTPFQLADTFLNNIRSGLPLLHSERIEIYTTQYGLSVYDAGVLTDEKAFSDYFDGIIFSTKNYKAAANWMLGPIRSWLNENNKDISDFPVLPIGIATTIALIEEGKLNFSIAATKLFPLLLQDPESDIRTLALQENLMQESDSNSIELLINNTLEKYADKVKEYHKGKKGLLSLFVGEVMKQSKGKADPILTNKILLEKLNSK